MPLMLVLRGKPAWPELGTDADLPCREDAPNVWHRNMCSNIAMRVFNAGSMPDRTLGSRCSRGALPDAGALQRFCASTSRASRPSRLHRAASATSLAHMSAYVMTSTLSHGPAAPLSHESPWSSSTQLRSTQLRSTQLRSTQLRSTQLRSRDLQSKLPSRQLLPSKRGGVEVIESQVIRSRFVRR